jgi:N-methylhydantoinase B
VLNLKSTQQVSPERRVVMELAGGGGFGHPFQRNPQAVLRDVVNGFVSIDAARDDYGVVIRRLCPADETVVLSEDFELDETATARLRTSGRSRCAPPNSGP